MDQHTSAAKNWLDRRYSRRPDGRYKAHQPIRGLRTEFSEPNALIRFARTYRLLEWLHSLEFESVLDIGGGEGYLAALIRDLFLPKVAHTCDLSVQANLRAHELFGISGTAADASRLPFADGAYDLVVCSEVIEHLSRPVLAIGELMRVARKYVVISTAEFSPLGEVERRLRVLTLDRSYPHAELNWFTPSDFTLLLGDNTAMSSQYKTSAHRLPPEDRNREEVERLVVFLADVRGVSVDQTGVIAVQAKGQARPQHQAFDPATSQRALDRLLEGPRPLSQSAAPAALDVELQRRLRCVRCRGHVELSDAGGLACVECLARYAVTQNVPAMLTDDGYSSDGRELEARCATGLAGSDPGRRERIRALMGQLHNSQAGRHGPAVHWMAGQSLRILWLFGRQEPWSSKLGRVLRRVVRRTEPNAANTLHSAGRDAQPSGHAAAADVTHRPQS